MKTLVSYKRAAQLAILFLMVLAIVVVWPLKIYRPNSYEGSLDKNACVLVQNEGAIMQEFIATGPELTFIEFYVYNEDRQEMEGGELIYSLFDENLNKLDEKRFSIEKLKIPGVCRIRVRGEIETGKRYYFTLENPNAALIFSMSDGVNLDARYVYRTYFSKLNYAIYALLVFLVGGACLFITERVLRNGKKEVRFDYGIRIACSVLLTMGALWLAWNIFPLQRFTTDWFNIVFLEVGVGLFVITMLYGLLHERPLPKRREFSISEFVGMVPTLLQTLAFAGVMAGCISYVNALYTYYQQKAIRTILVYFALAIIFGFCKKELFNWYNLIYMLCAMGCGLFYCVRKNTDEAGLELAKGSAAVAILWGIVIINAIRMLICYKEYHRKKVSKIYLITLILFIVEMIRRRNTKIWPIEIAVFFGLFAFRAIWTGKTEKYLNSFVNGVFLNFVGVTLYAMLFRPFHAYHHTRYASVFHTVTVAAVYDALVFSLALARFLKTYRGERKIKSAWKELVLVGVAGAYTILTISRTAYLTVIAVSVFALIVTAFKEYKDGILGGLKRGGMCLASSLILFIIVYSGSRLIPAIVSKPYIYEVEVFDNTIYEGEEWDSSRFVTVQRFFEVFADKLGIKDEQGLHPEKEQRKANIAQENGTSQADTQSVSDFSEELNEFSSGRIQIFKLYLENLNWAGHDSMALKDENGQLIQGHAHNTFIQAAYDFGIGAGVYFAVLCVFICIRSLNYYNKNWRESDGLAPLMIATVFCVSGMVEWVFQPHNPLGFAFLFIWMILVPVNGRVNYEKND